MSLAFSYYITHCWYCFLCNGQIKDHFKKKVKQPADVKYIDPTYMIRACRADASDSIMCAVLGQNAVTWE